MKESKLKYGITWSSNGNVVAQTGYVYDCGFIATAEAVTGKVESSVHQNASPPVGEYVTADIEVEGGDTVATFEVLYPHVATPSGGPFHIAFVVDE